MDCQSVAQAKEYKPSEEFVDNRWRNAWNAVYVAGSWRLVQPNWAAMQVQTKVGKEQWQAVMMAMAIAMAMAKAMAIATAMAKQIQGISKNHAKAHFCNICNKDFSLLFSEKMSEPDFCLSC